MDQAELAQTVARLADVSTRWPAVQTLMAAGPAATPAVRAGLSHRHASVRVACCFVLDHQLDLAAIPELLANVAHRNRKVRAWALHALACDRCKEGDCRPGAGDVVPLVLDRLVNDPSARVRRMAVGLASEYLQEPGVAATLGRVSREDPHLRVRRMAGYFAPGGRGYERKLAAQGTPAAELAR
jgi:hypothetical protein